MSLKILAAFGNILKSLIMRETDSLDGFFFYILNFFFKVLSGIKRNVFISLLRTCFSVLIAHVSIYSMTSPARMFMHVQKCPWKFPMFLAYKFLLRVIQSERSFLCS